MGYSDSLLPHALSRDLGLKQPPLCDGGVLEELRGPSFPLGDLFGHVEVPAVVGAVRVKGQLDPLLAKGHVHSFCVSEDEEPAWAEVLWGDGGRSFILFMVMSIHYCDIFGLSPPLHPGIQFLHIASLGEEPSGTVIGGLLLVMSETVYSRQGCIAGLGRRGEGVRA